MQFIIACDLFRHCLEVVRLIQISLSSFNSLKRETGGGGHLADINDKRGICITLPVKKVSSLLALAYIVHVISIVVCATHLCIIYL